MSQFAQALTLRVMYTDADLAKAGGEPENIRLHHYDALAQRWTDLTIEVDRAARVVTGQASHASLFAIIVDLPKPALLGPTEGTALPDLAPLLTWTIPPDTTQYQIQIIPSKNDGPGINLIRNPEESYQVQAPVMGVGNYVMLPGMTYTWRVRVSAATVGLGENDPGWSKWVSRTFKTAPPSSFTIWFVAPDHEGATGSLTPTIVWSNTNKAIFYYGVQVSKDPAFGPDAFLYWELRHAGVTEPLNSYRVPAAYPLEPATRYYWRVRPRVQGDGQPVAWSQTWLFTTPAPAP